VAYLKQGRASIINVFLASLLVVGYAFIFLYATELTATYWLSKKLHITRLAYYLAAYVVAGVGFGLGAALIQVLVGHLVRRRRDPEPGPLLLAVTVSALAFVLAFVVINARLLPHSSMLSGAALCLNLGLLCICVALFSALYLVSGDMKLSTAAFGAAGISGSVVVVAAVLHALMYKRFEWVEVTVPSAAGLALLFVFSLCLISAVELKVVNLMSRREGAVYRQRAFKRLAFGKAAGIAIVLVCILFVRRYRPLEAGPAGVAGAPPADKPNVIIIVLDTVRQDRLSVYGCERVTSPNIEKLADDSRVFDAYSTSPWTLPSHATIMTGLYPTESGTGPEIEYHIDSRNETLAEILKANGYYTAAVISNHGMLGHSSGLPQGFDYYYAKPRETELPFPFFASYFFKKFWPHPRVLVIVSCQRADSITSEAIRCIRQHGNGPFFLLLNYMDGHFPYVPPSPYGERWYREPPRGGFPTISGWVKQRKATTEADRRMLETEYEHRLGQYDGAIAYLDAQLGVLFEALKEMGLYDNSLIVLTSDHGEFFFEHDFLEHPGPPYQEVIRVPLIVKPPAKRGEKPERVSGSVSLTELFHMVLDYLAIGDNSGERRGSLLAGTSPVFSEFHLTREEDTSLAEKYGAHLYSLMDNNYKLIYSSKGLYEMYDLSTDPREVNNLIADGLTGAPQPVLDRMKSGLASHIERLAERRLSPTELTEEEREEIRRGLKTLGYIQ
jgi:arylsulfatase A-like enzyme